MRRFVCMCLVALAAFRAAGATVLSLEDQAAARRLSNAKCVKCHKFYDPAKYSDAQWQSWMTKMSRKAKLKPNETELLSRYLDGYRPSEGTNAVAFPKGK